MTAKIAEFAVPQALRERYAQPRVGSPYDVAVMAHASNKKTEAGRHAEGRRNLQARARFRDIADRAVELRGLVAERNLPRLENAPAWADSMLVHSGSRGAVSTVPDRHFQKFNSNEERALSSEENCLRPLLT